MPKPLIEHTKAVRMQPFGTIINVTITSDVNRSAIEREHLIGTFEPDPELDAVFCKGEKGNSYLFFHLKAKPGRIAHEGFHAIKDMLRYVGAGSDEEMEAYHLDHLVDAIHKLKERSSDKGKSDSRPAGEALRRLREHREDGAKPEG